MRRGTVGILFIENALQQLSVLYSKNHLFQLSLREESAPFSSNMPSCQIEDVELSEAGERRLSLLKGPNRVYRTACRCSRILLHDRR